MAGVNVLSDILKGGNKLEKTSTLKGNDIINSPENAAEVFAAMLNGSENLNANPKGHNFSKAGQESEEKQSAGNPVQSVQNLNGKGSMLGCGSFALPFLTQPMLQSDLPAGKEANSGNSVSQGTGGLATANASLTSIASIVSGNNFELAMLNLVSLASDEVLAPTGIATPKPQGDNPEITELDKYRQVIADLLETRFGEITDFSPKGNPLSSESNGVKDLSQDLTKILSQGAEGLEAPHRMRTTIEVGGGISGPVAEFNIETANEFSQDLFPFRELRQFNMNRYHVFQEVDSQLQPEDSGKIQNNPAVVFETLLSGFMKPNVDLKGQKSSIADQGSGEKQSTEDLVQSVQNLNEQGSMLGYGNFEIPYITQPMLQRNPPVGKVTNSENDENQRELVDYNPRLNVSSEVHLASNKVIVPTGMVTSKPQGDNPGITELDKYRQVIADLLKALWGEIKDLSPKVNSLSVKSFELNDSSQNMSKVVQGWALPDDVAKDSYAPRVESTSNQTTGSVEEAKVPQEGSASRANSSSTQALNHPEVLISELGETEEIKTSSKKENPISSENVVKEDFGKDKAYVIKGQKMKTDDVAKDSYAPRVEATSSQTTGSVEEANVPQEGSATRANSITNQALNQSETLYGRELGGIKTSSLKENPISSQSIGPKESSQDTAKVGRDPITLTNEVVKNTYGSNVQATNGEATLRVVTAKTSQEGRVEEAIVPQLQEGSSSRANSSSLNHPEALISELRETEEIKTSSAKENPKSSENVVKKDFGQDTAYVIKGQKMKRDDVAKDSYAPRVEATSSQTTGSVEEANVPQEGSATRANSITNQALNQSETLYGRELGENGGIKASSPKENLSSESVRTKELRQNTVKVERGQTTLTNEVVKNAYGSNVEATNGEATLRVVMAKTSPEESATKANSSSPQALNHQEVLISELGETEEIKTSSPKGNPIGSESVGTKDLSQDTAYVVQGQRMKTYEVAKDSYAPIVEAASSQTTGRVEAAIVPQKGSVTRANSITNQALNQSETLYGRELGGNGGIRTSSLKENPISSESIGPKEPSQDTAKVGRDPMTLTNEVVKNTYGSNVQATNGETTLRVVMAKTSPEGSVTKANSSSTQALNHPEALISELGETEEIKIKGNPIGSESVGTKDLSQDTAYVVQGQRMKTDDVAKDSYAPRVEAISSQTTGRVEASIVPQEGSATRANSITNQGLNHSEVLNILSTESIGTKNSGQDMQKSIQSFTDGFTTGSVNGNAVLNAKVSTLQAALYPIVRLEGKDLKQSHGKNETLEAEGNVIDVISKGRPQAFIKPIKGMEDDLFLRKFQRAFSKEIPNEIDSEKSSEPFEVKAPQSQNLSTGIGSVGNFVSVNSAETKTAAIPVWQQISNVFREQVLNRHQELKELDIQLHPADLGKIQINLRWENGQVHLQVQASEASTGQVLQNQLSELRQTLSNQGVNCGMLQMGQGGGERQQNSRGYEQPRPLNPNTQPNEDENLIQITNPLYLTQDVINRINVTA